MTILDNQWVIHLTCLRAKTSVNWNVKQTSLFTPVSRFLFRCLKLAKVRVEKNMSNCQFPISRKKCVDWHWTTGVHHRQSATDFYITGSDIILHYKIKELNTLCCLFLVFFQVHPYLSSYVWRSKIFGFRFLNGAQKEGDRTINVHLFNGVSSIWQYYQACQAKFQHSNDICTDFWIRYYRCTTDFWSTCYDILTKFNLYFWRTG